MTFIALKRGKRMATASSRKLIIMLSIALLILMLAACGGAKQAPVTVPEGAQAGDLVGLEPCTYEANKVKYDADCSTLVVPENRSAPDSRLIALPVIRVRATGDNPAEPIFYLSGGPGTSNLRFRYLEDLIEFHDFVLVGYRGVDGSVVLDCPEISETMRKSRGLLSDEALENYTTAGASCARRLQAEGVDLAGYTMVETIDDNEDARVALGYDRVSLLGASYGTRLERVHMLNTFFDTGQVDASLYAYQPLNFDVGLGWPGLAKLLVTILVLIVVIVTVVVWFLVRRVRRSRVGQA
jgi:pimeloyl-ACP methyl ester carboxylesterase